MAPPDSATPDPDAPDSAPLNAARDPSADAPGDRWTRAVDLDTLREAGRKVAAGVTLFADGDAVFAVGNRCPHMGYPMVQGTVRDGVVTCAWHRWEFSLDHGGCLRGACDDLPVFPVEVRDGAVWVQTGAVALDRARVEEQLAESLLDSDGFLAAKALARLWSMGAGAEGIARVAAAQAFRHAMRAHPGPQAVVELEAICDALMLAGSLADRAREAVALQGARVAMGPAGDRPSITPLPGPPLSADATIEILRRYTDEPSPLALERALLALDPQLDDDARGQLLLEAATHPWFVGLPGVLLHVAGALRATRWLGDEAARRREAALLAWVLGQERPPPEADDREAESWLRAHGERLAFAAGGAAPCSPEDVSEALVLDTVTTALDGLVGLLERGASPAAVLDGFAVLAARRLARLWLNNGGLWTQCSRLLRLVGAVRDARAEPRALAGALAVMAVEWRRTRWLQPGRVAPLPDVGPGPDLAAEWAAFESAFAAGDLAGSRAAVGRLAAACLRSGDEDSFLTRFVGRLLEEDQGALQLRTLVVAVGELRRSTEPLSFLLGVLGQALDDKQRRDVAAAARFGRTWRQGAVADPSPSNR